MQTISESMFLNVINKSEIKVSPEYPKSAQLYFHEDLSFWRFWNIPEDARRIPNFINAILDSIDSWEYLYVWKPYGSWNLKMIKERINDDIQAIIYKGIGIEQESADILQFNEEEYVNITALALNQLMFGWHVGDDVYIIPNHFNQIIKTDHHDVVHVQCKNENDLNIIINKMKERKFYLPEELPDSTFKKPNWMK